MRWLLTTLLLGCTAQTFDNEKIVDVKTDSGLEASTDAVADSTVDTADDGAEAAVDAGPDHDRCLAGAPRLQWKSGECWDTSSDGGSPFPCTFVKSAEGVNVRCFPKPLVEAVGIRIDDCSVGKGPAIVNFTPAPDATAAPPMMSLKTADGYKPVTGLLVKVENWYEGVTCGTSLSTAIFPYRNASGMGVRVGGPLSYDAFYNVP